MPDDQDKQPVEKVDADKGTPPNPKSAQKKEKESPYPHIKGMRILVAEDVTPMRRMLQRTFEMQGAIVKEAENGEVALSALQKSVRKNQPYDLVMLDLMMPVMNGGEVLQAMRADPGLQSVKVIIVSARSDKKAVLGAKSLGVSGYMRKPYQVKNVLEVVDALLAESPPSDTPPVASDEAGDSSGGDDNKDETVESTPSDEQPLDTEEEAETADSSEKLPESAPDETEKE